MAYDVEKLIDLEAALIASNHYLGNSDRLEALRDLAALQALRCGTCRHFDTRGTCVWMIGTVPEDGSGFCHRWEGRDA